MARSSSGATAILAAAALLPLTDMNLSQRFGTRHRAALGITQDTDAVAVVVSEESGQMSVVERARIVRVPSEAQLERALRSLLEAPSVQAGFGRRRAAVTGAGSASGSRPRFTRHRAVRPDPAIPEPAGDEDEGIAPASAPQ